MSQSNPGLSTIDVERIAARIAQSKVDALEKRIMSEISNLGSKLQRAIEIQTAAIIAGVGATTAAVVSTKSEISDTRTQLSEKLTLQLRSELQLELGRKLNVARSASAKFKQFFHDIRSRFEKSVEGVFINRTEYDERFNQIFDEYENKIRTIGEHIFQIRDEIRLVEVSSSKSLEEIYSLPIEVDLYRLELRSEELDRTVEMLESSRLKDITSSLAELKSAVNKLSYSQTISQSESYSLEALYINSNEVGSDVLLGAKVVRDPGSSFALDNSILDSEQSQISSDFFSAIEERMDSKTKRNLDEEEYQELEAAILTLSRDGIISPDDAVFAKSVIDSRKVSLYN